jgi:glutamyl-tRNA reductase
MNIVCFGLSHRTAEVEVRERFAFADRELPGAVRRLAGLGGVCEALILSTCNRVEHYAVIDDKAAGGIGSHPLGRHARELFWRHLAAENRARMADPAQFYHFDGARGVEHLFRVACGLESMVLGETEILGQVKQAYLVAMGAGTTGRALNKLFQRAFQVAKQVRSKTCISRGAVSVASASVDLAEKLFGDLKRCKGLVLGAGETGERTARSLISRGVKPERLLVANRSPERAAALAAALGGCRALPFESWEREADDVDILITSTAAPGFVVTKAQLEILMRRRADRPLFVIDIAVPRDVEPSANDIEGVYLYDIDALSEIARQAMESRRRELAACEKIIGGHVGEFSAWAQREAARLASASTAALPGWTELPAEEAAIPAREPELGGLAATQPR